ncbi:MAG: RT0821/Lpp0805 family surface protein [Nitrospinota bacterium]
MKKTLSAVTAAVLAVALSGCAEMGIKKETGGAVLGGVAGGVLGSQVGKGRGKTAAIIGGTILGALVGGAIGKQLDERDRLLMARKTQVALERAPSGQATEWRNPDNGHSGTITPQPAYQTRQGQYCREFQQTITIGGKTEQAYGTACRQPDGTWKIVK